MKHPAFKLIESKKLSLELTKAEWFEVFYALGIAEETTRTFAGYSNVAVAKILNDRAELFALLGDKINKGMSQ